MENSATNKNPTHILSQQPTHTLDSLALPSHLKVREFWPQMYSLSLSLHSRQHTQNSI